MGSPNFIIYHNNCVDGFAGLLIYIFKFPNKSTIYPDRPYSKRAPDIVGKDVLIIDVAYSPKVMKYIIDNANSVILIDHHKNHVDEIKHLFTEPNKIIFDENKCAAALVWNHYVGDELPLLIKYINDHDLGQWKYKETDYLITLLEVSYPFELSEKNIKRWMDLFDNNHLEKELAFGKRWFEYKDFLIDSRSKQFHKCSFPNKNILRKYPQLSDETFTVAVINNGTPSTSLIANRILKDNDEIDICFVWNYQMEKNKFIISVRSERVNVHKIAKSFNGGGHEKSACFTIKKHKLDIDDLFY